MTDAVERYTRELLDKLRPHIRKVTLAEVHMTRAAFDLLPEYSTSIPTGKTDGKVWKFDRWVTTRPEDRPSVAQWWMREYVEDGEAPEGSLAIYARKIVVVV